MTDPIMYGLATGTMASLIGFIIGLPFMVFRKTAK
jgi:hypothetical protein